MINTINANTVILTANKRLARWLVSQYDQHQKSSGQQSWKSLTALPFDSWIKNLYETLQLQTTLCPQTLLKPHQEKYLWKQIIENNTDGYHFLNNVQTTELAYKTWNMIHQHGIDLTHPDLRTTPEGRIFTDWAIQFQNMCEKKQWITEAELASKIAKNWNAIPEHIKPKKLSISGFLELPDDKKNLFKKTHFQQIQSKRKNQSCYRMGLKNQETEIYSMVRWAKKQWQKNPNKKIGCIVPNLKNLKQDIERIFREVFQIENQLLPYNFSSGKRLIDYPAIQSVFYLLKFIQNQAISFNHLSAILRSPFFLNNEIHIHQLAQLEVHLRQIGKTHWTLKNFVKISEQKPEYKDLTFVFSQYIDHIDLLKNQSFTDWKTWFQDILTEFKWTQIEKIQPELYRHFEEVLDQFGSLDTMANTVNCREAMEHLYQMVSDPLYMFQNQNAYDAPIQILGILESIDLEFDDLWIMSMDHQNWPTPAHPNPLLPIFLQKQYNLPHCDAKREFEYCKKIMDSFMHHNKNMIFSYAESDQEKPLRPSPLIQKFPSLALEEIDLVSFQKETLTRFEHAKKLEIIEDIQGPSLNDQEIKTMRGGTSILKDQAACPFRAFATHRLQARKLETPQLGFTHIDRGNIVHQTLENLFRQITSSKELYALTPEKLDTLIRNIIEKSIKKMHSKISNHLIEIEKKRIYKLIKRWIQYEKKREPFDIIAVESKQTIHLGKLHFNVRIDRVDRSAHHQIIIDYKTGNPSINNWVDERMDEPQLPLYAISQQASAIAFAQVNNKGIKFHGISAVENLLPNTNSIEKKYKISWDNQLNHWQKNLKKLADEFYEGYAKVDPKNPPLTCRHCDLKSFCRLES